MAFVAKNVQKVGPGRPVLEQWIQVSRATATLPQTSTDILFRVFGGRVRVRALVGEVTTIIQSSDPVAKISSKKLDGTPAAVGTAVDVASTVTWASLEVGSLIFVEGDGTAVVTSTAGAAFIGANSGCWIAPQGEIYLTTGASKTGSVKWDLWFQPLDAGAYVTASAAAVVI